MAQCVLRDVPLRDAPQDEGEVRGERKDPHAEEAHWITGQALNVDAGMVRW